MAEDLVLLRTSERACYRRCRQKYQWKYVDLLSHPRPKGALTFGSMVHVALERYYPPGVKRGVHPFTTFEELYEENAEYFTQWDDEGNKIPALELAEIMLNGYVDLYGADDDIEIINPEQTFAIDVYDEHGRYLVTYVGKVDATARRRSTGRLVLLEHKTAKTIEEPSIISGYGEQGMSYLWASIQQLRHDGLVGEGEIVDEVLFNILRKGKPNSDKARNADGLMLNQPSKKALQAAALAEGLLTGGTMDVLKMRLAASGWTEQEVAELGEVSKVQPSPLFARLPMEIQPGALAMFEKRLKAEAWEHGKFRKGMLPIIKNPTKDCSWECEFKELCELHEMGADWRQYRDIEMTSWDPYSDHEYIEEKTR